MAWTGQTFSVGQILTAAQMSNLQADITAQANGDAGAPRNTQDSMAPESVGQAELKTLTGSGSTSGTTRLVLSGGQYSFFVQTRTETGTSGVYSGGLVLQDLAALSSYTTNIWLTAGGPSQRHYVRNLWVSASPPYDLGDGPILLFVSVLLDSSTKIVESVYVTPEPTWINNGPTNTTPDFYKKENGVLVPYQKRRLVTTENFNKEGPINFSRYIDRLMTDDLVDVEITQEIKNKDMSILPHPFVGNDMVGKEVLLLDPMDTERLIVINDNSIETGEKGIQEMLYSGEIKISNTILDRATPAGVNAYGFTF